MNTPETRTIVERIDTGVDRVLERINVNTWIFSVVAVVVILMGFAVVIIIIKQSATIKLAESNRVLATTANAIAIKAAESAAGNTARQDILNKQFSDYIKQTVEVWNKLQADNASPQDVKRRGIKVPVAPQQRPPGIPLPADRDLERITRSVPAQPVATPTPKVKIIIKHVQAKQTPTPKPWYDYFKSTR